MVFKTSSMMVLLPLALLVAGCGGGGNDAAPAQTPGPQAGSSPILLVQGGSLGLPAWPDGSNDTGGRGSPVAGVNCLLNENYHIHAHLAIVKDGQFLAIPKEIGLQGCAYEMHTHDQSGIIHIETSAFRPFTLGQFFAVWGQPVGMSNVAGITGLPVAVYIDDGGNPVEFKGDPATIELTSHRAITIQIGSALAQIPTYSWPSGL
jgi:hypothetical protein